MFTSPDLAFGHEGAVLRAIAQSADGFKAEAQPADKLAILDSIQTNLDLLTTEYAFKILGGAAVAQARQAVGAQDTVAQEDLFCALLLGAKERADTAYCAVRDAGAMAN
jgi:hypothetical protein